jgi:hypothetical protein
MLFLFQTEWPELIKTVGYPTAILIVVGMLFRYGLWPWFKQQQAEKDADLKAAIEDARKERDYMRSQREKEVDKFIESLRFRDERFKEVADAIERMGRHR